MFREFIERGPFQYATKEQAHLHFWRGLLHDDDWSIRAHSEWLGWSRTKTRVAHRLTLDKYNEWFEKDQTSATGVPAKSHLNGISTSHIDEADASKEPTECQPVTKTEESENPAYILELKTSNSICDSRYKNCHLRGAKKLAANVKAKHVTDASIEVWNFFHGFKPRCRQINGTDIRCIHAALADYTPEELKLVILYFFTADPTVEDRVAFYRKGHMWPKTMVHPQKIENNLELAQQWVANPTQAPTPEAERKYDADGFLIVEQ